MGASMAGEQRTNAVKIYWSIDQIRHVRALSRCSVRNLESSKRHCMTYQECEP